MVRDQLRLRITRDVFFWIGAACAGACLIVVVTGHTVFGSSLEHMPVPLSWALAGAAIIALSVTEYCHAVYTIRMERSAPATPAEPANELGVSAQGPPAEVLHSASTRL